MAFVFKGELVSERPQTTQTISGKTTASSRPSTTQQKSLFKSTGHQSKPQSPANSSTTVVARGASPFPIFRLPKITTQIVNNKIPTDDAVLCEIKKKEAENSMKFYMRDALDITNEEFMALEMEFEEANPRQVKKEFLNNHSASMPVLPPLSNSMNYSHRSSESPQTFRRTQTLKSSLHQSTRNAEFHKDQLLRNYIDSKSLCTSQLAKKNLHVKRARQYLLQLSIQHLEKCVTKHYMGLRNEYFYDWRDTILYEKEHQKRLEFLKMKAITRLELIAISYFHRLIKFYYRKWYETIQYQINYDKHIQQMRAAIIIQTCYRGYSARQKVYAMKHQNYLTTRKNGAIKIQTTWRGYYARKYKEKLMLEIFMKKCAIVIQCAIRQHLAVKNLEERRLKAFTEECAIIIQSQFRCYLAMQTLAKQRLDNYINYCVLLIQSIWRGHMARRQCRKIRIKRNKNMSATLIQKIFRGLVARRKYEVLKTQHRKLEKLQQECALKIQVCYRSHKSRIVLALKKKALERIEKLENQSATKIQACYRGYKGKERAKKVRIDRLKHMVNMAKEWLELWDDHAHRYYFRNIKTDEILWEPPPDGFTNRKKKLVLKNGDIIDEPDFVDKRKELHVKKCVECLTNDATRDCVDCDDECYCDTCFIKCHKETNKENHKYHTVNPMKCVECDTKYARKYCLDCEDGYCDSCYKFIHAKGKKSNHKWVLPGEDTPKVDKTLCPDKDSKKENDFIERRNTIEDVPFQTAGYYETTKPFYDTKSQDSRMSDTNKSIPINDDFNNWTEMFDENSSCKYWINNTTGESQWDNPFGEDSRSTSTTNRSHPLTAPPSGLPSKQQSKVPSIKTSGVSTPKNKTSGISTPKNKYPAPYKKDFLKFCWKCRNNKLNRSNK